MKKQSILITLVVAAILIAPAFSLLGVTPVPWHNQDITSDSTPTDRTRQDMSPEGNPVYFGSPSGAMTSWEGSSSGLPVNEYGNRSDTFTGNQMTYNSSDQSTTDTSVSVPIGAGWEGYNVFVSVEDLTENRTWVQDPEMEDSPSTWTLTNGLGQASWLTNGSGPNNDSVQFSFTGDPNVGKIGYASQTFAVPRGDVLWAGLRLDYWINSSWSGGDGFAAIYVTVESSNYNERVWQKSFNDVEENGTWHDSGLIEIPDLSIFDLSDDVYIEVGLYHQQNVNYSPDLDPEARADGIELYMKTLAAPSNVNLKVEGEDVNNYTIGGTTIYGMGNVSYTPPSEWTSSPVSLQFSWTPNPLPPSPNRTIKVDFKVNTNLYARTTNFTVSTQDPTAYGETFYVENATDVEYQTWHYADIPNGYDNRYDFNITLPDGRDIYYVGSPLLTTENITTWSEGEWWARIPAYDYADRWGYWLIRSSAPNMVDNILMHHAGTGAIAQSIDLRANDQSSFITVHDASFAGLDVNITIFDPSGSVWHSELSTINSTGHAETSGLTFGTNASAGGWQVQATVNNSLSGSAWNKTGFFVRNFKVIHSSTATLLSPEDAVATWIANVTYPDLFLVRVLVNDTDITGVTIPGGIMTYNWTDGAHQFGDNGDGEYIVTLDSSELSGNGEYIINIEWTHPYFDTITETLTVYLNYDADIVLISPDSPSLDGPVGDNQTFRIKFQDYFGSGIDYGGLSTNWSNPDYITEVSGSPGVYDIALDTTAMALGDYVVNLTATANFVLPQHLLVYVTIREIYTEVTYLQNVLQIPVGEAASFTVDWYDADHDTPLTGRNDSIVSNWSLYHSQGDMNYTVQEISPGSYNVTIYTVDSDALGTYPVHFNLTGYLLQNQTFTIDVIVEQHQTIFLLDEPVQQTDHGTDIVVLVFYEDTDLGLGITNDTGDILISVTTPEVASLSFSVSQSSFGDGHYNITIASDQWATTGRKNLSITIESLSGKYSSKFIDTSVRLIGRRTDLYLEDAPIAVNYLENFTFSIVYLDAVNSSQISNKSGNVILQISPLGTNNPATQNDFMIWESGADPGLYYFTINSTKLQSIDTFRFGIFLGWRSAVTPLYENQSLTVTLLTLHRPTYLDTNPVPSTAYGEDTTLEFSYVDTLSTKQIDNSSQLSITINNGSVVWSITYDSNTRTFFITLDTASLGGVGDFVLYLNVTWQGAPFYESIPSKAFTVSVVLRSTQLSHNPFLPGQFGNNITIDFVYTDLISGSSVGMTGVLSLNVSSAHYNVEYMGDGQYRVEVNTIVFGNVGQYYLNASIVYNGSNFAADAVDIFLITVSERETQLTYESPDATPYLENFTILVSYSDDSTGAGINNATITVESAPLSLTADQDYWVIEIGNGEYTVLLNSSSLGSPGDYSLNVSASKSGPPYYSTITKTIGAIVTERPTQILITKTPGSVPFLEFISIQFKFEDFLSNELIDINKTHIILTHGDSKTVISSSEYTLTVLAESYEISFNSTLLNDSVLVTSHSVQIYINKTGVAPYHAERAKTTLATTTERPTQIQFPLIQNTPFGDNITIELNYIDYLVKSGIEGANLSVSSSNLTTFINYSLEISDGLYRLLIPSSQFGQTGVLYFDVMLYKSGIPYYAARTATNIPATIRNVITSISYETPPAGVIPIGDPFRINITYNDNDHDSGIPFASIFTNWTILYGQSYTVTELDNGRYQVTLNTTGMIAQEYALSISASRQYYDSSEITISIQPGAPTVQINLERSTYYTDWGQLPLIRFTVTDSYYDALISGMNATLLFNDTLYYFNDPGNGSYYIFVNTSHASYGVYNPVITVSREFYQTRQRDFTLVIYKASGQILPESTSIQIVRETESQFWIYLNDTVNDKPVAGATAYMDWNNTIIPLTANGTRGYYVGVVNVSGFSISTYELVIVATAENHEFLTISIDVNVIPVPTSLVLQDGATSLSMTFGDVLEIYVDYNDTYYGGFVNQANVSFTLGSYSGTFEQHLDGRFYAEINSTLFSAQTLYLRVVAKKDGYAQASRTAPLNILPVPTDAIPDVLTQDAFRGDTVNYTLYLNDTHLNRAVLGANVTIEWAGSTGDAVELGGGYYLLSIFINNSIPRLYDVDVSVTKPNYQTSALILSLLVKPTGAVIESITQIDVPVNDSAIVIVNLYNALTNEIIDGVNGLAVWETLGSTELALYGNGSYYLTIPDDLPIGQYRAAITFTTNIYEITPQQITVNVRQVHTELIYGTTQIDAFPGAAISIRISYIDTDHNTGISGVIPTVSVTEGEITYFPGRLVDYENGTYQLFFEVIQAYTMYINIQFSRNQHQTQSIEYTVFSDLTPAQQAQQTAIVGGGTSLIIVAILVLLYVRVWSIPKIVRKMNKMIKSLSKGKIPSPAEVTSRQDVVMTTINDELKPLNIRKARLEVAEMPIVVRIPEVNELLEKLVEITGLGDEEIEAFRQDLSRMKASERPGFLKEVIEQEEARRADELAEKEMPTDEVVEDTLDSRPDELEELRDKLTRKGIPKDEVDILLEEAKGLSKADIESLLDSLGLDLD